MDLQDSAPMTKSDCVQSESESIHFARKQQFIEHYNNGTLHLLTYTKEGRTYKFSDSLMYPFVYAEHKEKLKGETNE